MVKHTKNTFAITSRANKFKFIFFWIVFFVLPLNYSKAQALDSLFMRDQKVIVGLVQSVGPDSLIILQEKDGKQTSLSLALGQISHAVYRDGLKQVFEASVSGGSAEAGIPGEGQYVGPQTDEEMFAQGVQDGKSSVRKKQVATIAFLSFVFMGVTYLLPLWVSLWYILKKPKLEKNKKLNTVYLNNEAYRQGAARGIKIMKARRIFRGFGIAFLVLIIGSLLFLILYFQVLFAVFSGNMR